MGYCNECKCNNSILLQIVVNDLINPYLEITLQNNSVINTDILSINNGLIEYELPINYVYDAGTLKIRILAKDYSSNYVEFNVSDSLTADDDIVVKIGTNNYTIKKVSTTGTSGDSLPVGTIVDYDGDTVPDGYEEVEEWVGIDYTINQVSTGTLKIYKCVTNGKKVIIDGNMQYSSNTTAGTTYDILTIDEAYKPKYFVDCFTFATTIKAVAYIERNTNLMKFRNFDASQTYGFNFSLSWDLL